MASALVPVMPIEFVKLFLFFRLSLLKAQRPTPLDLRGFGIKIIGRCVFLFWIFETTFPHAKDILARTTEP